MNKKVTVDEAISKGHRMVTFPSIFIFIGVNCFCFLLGFQEILPYWIFPVGIGISFVVMIFYGFFMITKWKRWAIENVIDVKKLKERAVQHQLIMSNDSFFEKNGMLISEDIEKISSLKNKFDTKHFNDDTKIPIETILYNSKVNYIIMVLMLCVLGFGIIIIILSDSYIFGSIVSLFGAYFGYDALKIASDREPQIIINDKGIKTKSTDFYKWEDIENEEAIDKRSGKHNRYYLTYDYPGGSEHFYFNNINKNPKEMNKLLRIYRRRSEKKNNYR